MLHPNTTYYHPLNHTDYFFGPTCATIGTVPAQALHNAKYSSDVYAMYRNLYFPDDCFLTDLPHRKSSTYIKPKGTYYQSITTKVIDDTVSDDKIYLIAFKQGNIIWKGLVTSTNQPTLRFS